MPGGAGSADRGPGTGVGSRPKVPAGPGVGDSPRPPSGSTAKTRRRPSMAPIPAPTRRPGRGRCSRTERSRPASPRCCRVCVRTWLGEAPGHSQRGWGRDGGRGAQVCGRSERGRGGGAWSHPPAPSAGGARAPICRPSGPGRPRTADPGRGAGSPARRRRLVRGAGSPRPRFPSGVCLPAAEMNPGGDGGRRRPDASAEGNGAARAGGGRRADLDTGVPALPAVCLGASHSATQKPGAIKVGSDSRHRKILSNNCRAPWALA